MIKTPTQLKAQTSPNNAAFMKAEAAHILMAELQKGFDSAEKFGWISEEEADRMLVID